MAYSFEDSSIITCVEEMFYFSSWLQAKHTQTNNPTRDQPLHPTVKDNLAP